MNFYLAGVMRGSEEGSLFKPQGYRNRLVKLIEEYFPGSEIYDPLGQCDVQDSNNATFEDGRKVYFEEVAEAAKSDVLIAFLPEASMGTAIEMWQAYMDGVYIISITRMRENWTVRYLSNVIFANLTGFEFALQKGLIKPSIDQFLADVSTRYLWDGI